MKFKMKFNYSCEFDVTEDEVKLIKNKINDEFISGLTDEINDMFLAGDGRTEAGMISNFNYEVEE